MSDLYREDTLGGPYAEDRRVMEERRLREQMEEDLRRIDGEEAPVETEIAPIETDGIASKAKGAAKAVASDVARGLPEVPLKLAAGAVEAFSADPIDLLGDLAGNIAGKERVPVEGPIATALRAAGNEPFDKAAAATREYIASVTAGPPETVTGEFAKQTGNFVAAFVPIIGQLGKAGKPITSVGKLNQAAVGGAIADFLTTDTGGEEGLRARLEQARIGAVTGVALDGLVAYLRAVRAARRAAKLAVESGEVSLESALKEPQLAAEKLRLSAGFGEEEALVRKRPITAIATNKLKQAEKDLQAKFGDTLTPERLRSMAETEATDVDINFDRISTTEDVERLMQDATDLFKESIDKSRRGKRSNEATQEAADAMGLSIGELLSRRRGQALNAEEATAFRKVWASAAEKVEEMARLASGPDASDVAVLNFRRSLAIFHAINKEVLGARAEAGRALQAWSITAAGDTERARVVSALLQANGGEAVSRAFAERIASVAGKGYSARQIAIMAERGWGAKTMDAVKESYVLGLLWTPSTHMVNLTSNSIVPIQQMAERGLAMQIGRLMGDVPGEGVAPGEALAMYKGIINGIRAALRIGTDSRQLREQAVESVTAARGKIDIQTRAISSEAFGLNAEDGLGKFVDFVGSATRAPGWALQKEDDFFKVVGYAAELQAQSLRQATKEGAENGWKATRIAERAAELASNPPENLRLASVDAALYNTFQQDVGKFGRSLMNLRDSCPPAVLALPFIRTPMNLLRYTFERTPMAPLVGQWRQDIRAGGARAEIAMARMAVGSATFAAMLDYAYEGHISGPPSREHGIREARLRQGLQPDSIRIGEHTFKINRVDPFGLQLSVAAGIAELMKTYQVEDEDLPELSETIAAAVMLTSDAVLDKTWFKGVSDVVSAFQDPRRFAPSYFEKQVQGLVPFSTLIRSASAVAEPTRPDVSGWLHVQSMVDGLMTRLPRRRNLWGEEIEVDVVNVFSPARIDKVEENPIDQEILRLGADIRRINRSANFEGVPVNFRDFPHVYEEYVKLAGNELRHPGTGKGAKDFLVDLVTGKSALSSTYDLLSDGPDGQKQAEIRRWIADYRRLAQDRILRDPDGQYQSEEFVRFRDIWEKKQKQINQLLLPGAMQ